MSKYAHEPLSFRGLKTIPLKDRAGKVKADDFAKPHASDGVRGLIDSLPHILAADALRAVTAELRRAQANKKAILWGLGGHVIKCGLAPVLIDLMHRGYATAFVLNGAAAIHDFEIAIAGQTSEDVEAALPDGRFGAAEETGREMNLAIAAGARQGLGMGEGLGQRLEAIARPEFAPHSLLIGAYQAATPVTVHVAVGTDTPHTHPAADAAAIGEATHRDFRLLCSLV